MKDLAVAMRVAAQAIGNSDLPTSTRWRPRVSPIAVVLWLIAVATGSWSLLAYENTPGITAAAPERWPSESRIEPVSGRATLVMIAHPHCPCTRASIGELAQLMASSQGRVAAFVLFLKPTDTDDDWTQTDLRRSAAAIPGVTVLDDADGREGGLFRAETSGQTLLYDPQGRLLFSGGITLARGHAGDNPGRTAVASLLAEGGSVQRSTAVFGCPLHAPAAEGSAEMCRE